MHNFKTVISFEVARTLKKKSFWVAALAIPVIGMVIVAIILLTGNASSESSSKLANEKFTIGLYDNANIIMPGVKQALSIQDISSAQQGIQSVKNKSLDAFYVIPEDLSKQPVQVYAKSVGLYQNSRYSSVMKRALLASAQASVPEIEQAILKDTVSIDTTTYTKDGAIDAGYAAVIVPGIFLLLFYLLIGFFSNQILMSITEEKENRVIEIILTTIQPTTLLFGKLLSLIILAFTQIIIIIVPLVIGFLLFRDKLTIPNFDLSTLVFDPYRIILGGAIFLLSFIFFSAFIMAVGAAVPTAKDAGAFFGTIIALVFAPLYAAPLFVTSPDSLVVKVLSYIPFTAPIPLLLQNAIGNLSGLEALLSVIILLISTFIAIIFGVRIFARGALEYNRKLSFKEIFRRS